MQPQWEVADVLRHTHFEGYNVQQQKTLRALKACRTAALGGHVDACEGCGNISISYNSCCNTSILRVKRSVSTDFLIDERLCLGQYYYF